MKRKIILVTLCIYLAACAQIRNPTGGPKDKNPPEIIKSNPPNKTTLFDKTKGVEITFNEFIKLNKLNQELIVSPPISPAPLITSKGKKLKMNFNSCDLLENTTYSINLGQAVVDYNESNPYRNFTYVFSTGSSIDSLEINGTLWDIKTGIRPANVSVLLYSNLTDTFHKTEPSYLVLTDSNGNYTFQNLPPKPFSILAIEDKNKNKKIDYKELIGFSSSVLDLKAVNGLELETIKLFNYTTKTNIILKDTIYGRLNNKYVFNKSLEDVLVTVRNKNKLYSKYTIKQDTLIVYPNRKKDTIDIYIDTILYSSGTWDSITTDKIKNSYFISNQYILHENDTISLQFTNPIDTLNPKNISILTSQNKILGFKINKISEFIYGISALFQEDKKYTLLINKGLIDPDSFNTTPDSITIKTLANNTLGNLICIVSNYSDTTGSKVLVLYKGDKKIESKNITGNNITFNYLKSGTYTLKIIDDTNKDGTWTSGSFEKKIHPEHIIHYKNPIDIKENWDIEVNITL